MKKLLFAAFLAALFANTSKPMEQELEERAVRELEERGATTGSGGGLIDECLSVHAQRRGLGA